MESGVTLLIHPLPGVRIVPDGKKEAGSIIALRRDGDECLYVPDTEEEKGMEWLPIGQFSVDPEAVAIPDLEPAVAEVEPGTEPIEEQPQTDEPAESAPVRKGPFGRGLKRRKEFEA
jgi:hypothetical protein